VLQMIIWEREFRRNLKALLIRGAALGAMILLMLSIFSSMAEQTETLNNMLETYPENLKKVFGMDRLDMTTLIGFYGVEIYMFTTLFGSIYASMLASGILAKEENEKTAEFLLSKPVTRVRVVTEKLLAVVGNILIFNVITALMSVIGFQIANGGDVPADTFVLLLLATFLLHLTFAAVSFFLSSIMKKTRAIVSASLGIVLISYFLDTMSGVSESMENVGYASLFKYVKATDIVTNNRIDSLSLLIMGAVIIIGVGFAYRTYWKKDIAA
jgi:ABC-2 type transport system permease protein